MAEKRYIALRHMPHGAVWYITSFPNRRGIGNKSHGWGNREDALLMTETAARRAEWKTTDGPLKGSTVCRIYQNIADGKNPIAGTGIPNRSDRRADKALSILKRKGFVYYDWDLKKWVQGRDPDARLRSRWGC